MTFLAPERLWLLAGVLAVAGAYVAAQRRRRRYTVRFASLDLFDAIAPRRPGWRRHIVAATFLLALAALVTGLARPTTLVAAPRREAIVVLAIDVSPSMMAEDVAPSRLRAAQQAATQFVRSMPDGFRVGLVEFAGTAQVAVSPTWRHDEVTRSLATLDVRSETAIGEAIHASLGALEGLEGATGPADRSPRGVVVMSDGASTTGRSDERAARAAAAAGVSVTTIAFGTPGGTVTLDGERVPVPPEPAALRAIARTGHGRFFEAATTQELESVYSTIGSELRVRVERREATIWLLAVGIALLVICAIGSLLWFARLP